MHVLFYKTSSGRSPVRDFIDEQLPADQVRFFDLITEIENHGFNASRTIFKPLEGKLWEIKFRAIGGGFRVLYAMIDKDKMV